jgi:hypothetical protein
MNHLSLLLDKRDAIVSRLSRYSRAVAGNLSKSKVTASSDKYYWRITWKEKQKTKIQYIRPIELKAIREGVDQFVKLRKAILQLGEVNRAILLLQRDKK